MSLPSGSMFQTRKKKLKTRKERNKRRAKALKVKEVVLADVVQRAGAAVSIRHGITPPLQLEIQILYPKL